MKKEDKEIEGLDLMLYMLMWVDYRVPMVYWIQLH